MRSIGEAGIAALAVDGLLARGGMGPCLQLCVVESAACVERMFGASMGEKERPPMARRPLCWALTMLYQAIARVVPDAFGVAPLAAGERSARR